MASTSKPQGAVLKRLDKLTGPIQLDGEEENLDACAFVLGRMATEAMNNDALRDAHRLHDLCSEVEGAEEQGGTVEIPMSYALRLSAKLQEYRKNLRYSGDMEGAEDVQEVIQVIDGKITDCDR